jgi:hypothetical protein
MRVLIAAKYSIKNFKVKRNIVSAAEIHAFITALINVKETS